MTAVVPSIHVFMKKNKLNTRPGMAGKVAIIGAFDTTDTTVNVFNSLDECQTAWGDDTQNYNGCDCAKQLFKGGASSLVAVNFTTETGTPETRDKTLDATKLTACLTKIKGEDWDILFVAENMTDAYISLIDSYLDATFEMKLPAGYTGALVGQTSAANVTSAGLAGDHCYGLITQPLEVNGETLTVLQSIAYYTGLIASMNVGNTMTMKTVAGVTGLGEELSFETGGVGKTYLEAGITTFKCANRSAGRYVVVNSEQPNGYDLYINRVRDFVIKEFGLHEFLGERNRKATLSEIDHMIAGVKERCVTDLDLLEDIKYHIVKKNANCVDVYIDSLLFAGIITRIDVYVTIEVE